MELARSGRGFDPYAPVSRVEEIPRLLACLTKRQAEVIVLRYGLLDGQGRTLVEVGEALGITWQAAQIREAMALRKMRWKAGIRGPP